jgi:hypothetical protein
MSCGLPGIRGRLGSVNLSEGTTTIKIYGRERDWLLARQRKVSFDRNETVTMADLIREFVQAIERVEAGA